MLAETMPPRRSSGGPRRLEVVANFKFSCTNISENALTKCIKPSSICRSIYPTNSKVKVEEDEEKKKKIG